MNINWYYFSDTNTSPGEIQTVLEKKGYSLTSTHQLNTLHQYLIKNQESVLFLRANSVFNVYDLSQEISVLYPHVYIVLISPDNMENLKKAMHMGASDILRASYTAEEVKEVILQATKYMEHRANKENIYSINLKKEKSRVIAVCNPKGGVGRTSLTVNLAAIFARKGKKVAVIDGDMQFGDIAMFFNQKPKRTIYEWVKEAYGRPNYSIDQYMVNYDNNISILAAPPRPEFFEGITEGHLKTAIEEAKKLFDVVLIDTPAYLSEIHIGCLEEADEIIHLTINELSVLRISKLYLEMLDTIQLKDKTKIVLNRNGKGKGLDQKRVEEILGSEIFFTLPDQESIVSASIASGQPFVLMNARNQLSKAIGLLSGKLVEEEKPDLENKKEKRWLLVGK